jgi:HEAT repeat protein
VDDFETLLTELTCGEDARAWAASKALVDAHTPPISKLSKLLETGSPDERWWATVTLARIDDPRARRGLIKSLGDPDLSVRQCAALGLRAHPSEEAISCLEVALLSPDPMLSRLAADALSAIGEPAALILIEAMRSSQGRARIEAARALADMRLPSTIPNLFEALDDPSFLVAYWAEEGLRRMNVGMLFFSP